MIHKKDEKQIMREFEVRQNRQLVAIAVTLVLVLFCALLYKRPDLFGEYSKVALFGAQIAGIAVFMNFTAFNWRCPSCKTYLGATITRRSCGHCGARLR